jgi:hypothetical protein
MCFTAIIQTKGKLGKVGYSLLLNMISEHYKQNNDGYSIRFYYNGDYVKRTLDLTDFLNFILAHKEKIENSNIAHLHLRKSTNKVCEEYCHLWRFNGYFCSHNGIILSIRNGNDSLEFFKMIKRYLKTDKLHKIKSVIESMSGWGVFLLSSVNKVLLISYGKAIQSYKINDVFVFCSDEIDLNLRNRVIFEIKTAEKSFEKFGFNFTTSNQQSFVVNLDDIHISDYAHAEKENFILLIKNLEKSHLLSLMKKYNGYPKGWYYTLQEDYKENWGDYY